MKKLKRQGQRCFVVYREQMLKLLRYPKPTHAQLIIELPALMGLRASEVALLRAEYLDYKHGETLIFDSKKKKLFTIPLNIQVAAHAEQILNGKTEGYILQNRSSAWRGRNKPLSATAIWQTWKKWAYQAGLTNWREFSPLHGRRWFACYWYHYLGLSLMTLSMIMRHSDVSMTLHYVMKLIFLEDLKEDYRRFQLDFTQKDVKSPLHGQSEKEMKAWPTHGW